MLEKNLNQVIKPRKIKYKNLSLYHYYCFNCSQNDVAVLNSNASSCQSLIYAIIPYDKFV